MRLVRDLVGSRTLWAALALVALYWLVAAAVANGPLMEGVHAVRIAIGVAVTVAYGVVCLDALLVPKPDRVQQLTLGIALAWTGAVFGGGWALLWRLSGQPAWMVNSALDGFWIWLQILGGVLHITAPGAVDGVIPRRNWIMLGLAFGFGALVAAGIVAVRPDLRTFVAALEPYLAR